VVCKVEYDPVGLPRKLAVAAPSRDKQGFEWRGEAVEGHLEELDLLPRDVGRRLGAVR
jgi:hypothetical protein